MSKMFTLLHSSLEDCIVHNCNRVGSCQRGRMVIFNKELKFHGEKVVQSKEH